VAVHGGTDMVDFHTATSSVYLYGGTGNDFLYGGTGTNTFEFATGCTALSGSGVHAITDPTQTITNGNDVITSSHTGANSITLLGAGCADDGEFSLRVISSHMTI
jgi:Ca2+-binding RTX toxin-like protein